MAVAEKAGYAIVHAIMRTVSVLAVLSIVGLIVWALWVAIVKPHTSARTATSTTHQNAEKIVNQDLTIEKEDCWVSLFGVKTLCFKDKVVHKIIKEEGELKLEKSE